MGKGRGGAAWSRAGGQGAKKLNNSLPANSKVNPASKQAPITNRGGDRRTGKTIKK